MGCDIHIQIEKRVDGVWQRVPWVDDWKAAHPQWYPDAKNPDAVKMPCTFDNRNYDLFGVLADVRNGTWGAPVQPIAQPRGLPDDMDRSLCRVDDAVDDDDPAVWLGDHSFSWLTLREIQNYQWDAPQRKRGWVGHDEATEFRRTGVPPTSYSAGGNHGEYIEWMTKVRDGVGRWVDDVLPVLSTLGEPDDVRIVFGFDN